MPVYYPGWKIDSNVENSRRTRNIGSPYTHFDFSFFERMGVAFTVITLRLLEADGLPVGIPTA